ncbi:TonB-dependent receptor [Pseudidiomarina mangrovi]|uniref:TonB-dependent receptor n=1 Tax=Pseudidiomarina mangrovi TaxID=2487133 RepID=UPI000FC9EB26|nr:TonB-dependent receptor [Pseudidiomarina mangrovi]
MWSKTPIALIVAAVCAGSLQPSYAQQAQNNDDSREHQHENTEVIRITADPLARNQLNSAQPVTVLAGDLLREQQQHTLGDTLADLPGISATHFAGVASSPIIRGLDGPRVKITQNGLDTADVSRGSPDHAVTTETSTAQQIEILRGPATLLYGSGAIGGVVNVVDQRIAQNFVGGQQGFFGLSLDSASNRREGQVGFSADHKSTVWHADAFKRRSDDYEVPTYTNDEGERLNYVENSFVDAQGINTGVSYIFDEGYFGVSYGRLEQQYGIPGHAHHGEEHDDEHGDEHADEHGEEVGPFGDLWQNRIQVHGGWQNPTDAIKQLELRYGFTDYQHQEIEDGNPATTFTNRQHELRLIANHQPLAGWNGAVGYHYFDQQQQAFGEEAYTPPSDTSRHALFWLLEQQLGEFNWQTGARVENVSVTASNAELLGNQSYDFTPVSASLGFTVPLNSTLQLALNLSHAQRAPSANEIFSNGAHLATQTYELGLVYELHEEAEHDYHIELNSRRPAIEKANTIDLSLHYEQPNYHLDYTIFYNRINDFVFSAISGVNSLDLSHGDEHGDQHADEHGGEHDHEEGLPVLINQQRDVELFGYELSGAWRINERWELSGFSDFIRARSLDGDGNLPRIPAHRFGTDLRYLASDWEAKLGYTYYFKHEQLAANETVTDSFALLDAQLNLFPQTLSDMGMSVYLKAENLTNELGLLHTSFLKEDAPIRGRNFSIGLRGEF